jgi:proteasome lid subunit RPN8/RPN11
MIGISSYYGLILTARFTVPFEEDEKDPTVWFLDHNYVESMNDMFKKINAKEKLIGWYHSGPKLRASDLEINELFKRYTPNPLLVIIDVQPKEAGVPTDAYFAIEEIKDVGAIHAYGEILYLTSYSRTEPPHPRPLCTRHRSSRQRRQKRSESSTYYETSATSQSARFQQESHHSCSRSKACI